MLNSIYKLRYKAGLSGSIRPALGKMPNGNFTPRAINGQKIALGETPTSRSNMRCDNAAAADCMVFGQSAWRNAINARSVTAVKNAQNARECVKRTAMNFLPNSQR